MYFVLLLVYLTSILGKDLFRTNSTSILNRGVHVSSRSHVVRRRLEAVARLFQNTSPKSPINSINVILASEGDFSRDGVQSEHPQEDHSHQRWGHGRHQGMSLNWKHSIIGHVILLKSNFKLKSRDKRGRLQWHRIAIMSFTTVQKTVTVKDYVILSRKNKW